MSVVFISSRFRLNRDGSPPSSLPQSKRYTRTDAGGAGALRCAPSGGGTRVSNRTDARVPKILCAAAAVIAAHLILAARYSLLATRGSLLAACHSQLATRGSLLAARGLQIEDCSSLVAAAGGRVMRAQQLPAQPQAVGEARSEQQAASSKQPEASREQQAASSKQQAA